MKQKETIKKSATEVFGLPVEYKKYINTGKTKNANGFYPLPNFKVVSINHN